MERSPEDEPDVIYVGPVGPIPIIDDDDPRFEQERAAWSAATTKAQSLLSTEELLSGLRDPDWRVRHDCIDRIVARWKDDPRTVDAVLKAAAEDPAWQVRDNAMMRLREFDRERVRPVLLSGLRDTSEDVRWSAQYVLEQLGLVP
jgi:HEAT repeat protein